jgi:hypothetical protein
MDSLGIRNAWKRKVFTNKAATTAPMTTNTHSATVFAAARPRVPFEAAVLDADLWPVELPADDGIASEASGLDGDGTAGSESGIVLRLPGNW